MKTVIKLIASGLYLGNSPFAPGTLGSALGLLIFFQVKDFFVAYLSVCALLVIMGLLVSSEAEKIYAQKDPRRIVIDEIAGMVMVFLGVKTNLWIIILGFIIYRIFDIAKPFPVKESERLKGGLGIMADDLICALYTNIILQVLIRLPLKIGS
ncbi:MAG: phosphatidylglycerophosphatase A [Candidatus Omnitrophica bacterium]|nr:phosphatidylglycerophosphatase A [Candidatus Omnitrophota bacterium]